MRYGGESQREKEIEKKREIKYKVVNMIEK